MGVCYLYGAYVAYTIGSHMFSHPLLVQLVKVSFRAGSHLNRTGTGSAFLCDSYATLCSVIFLAYSFEWSEIGPKAAHSLLFQKCTASDRMVLRYHEIRFKQTHCSCDLLLGYRKDLYWQPQRIAHPVRFECGAGNTHGMQVPHTVSVWTSP